MSCLVLKGHSSDLHRHRLGMYDLGLPLHITDLDLDHH